VRDRRRNSRKHPGLFAVATYVFHALQKNPNLQRGLDLTLGDTSKVAPPPWYKGGVYGTLPYVFVCVFVC